MKFNINIIILPATRFVLLKLTTVTHSSQFKSFFFVYCSFCIIGPYPLNRLCYAIYCVPGADTMVPNHFCERPDLVIKIRGIPSTIKIAVAFPLVSSVTSPLLQWSQLCQTIPLCLPRSPTELVCFLLVQGRRWVLSNHCPFRGFHRQQKFPFHCHK